MKRVLWILLGAAVIVALLFTLSAGRKEGGETLRLYYPASIEDMRGGGDAIATVHINWREMR